MRAFNNTKLSAILIISPFFICEQQPQTAATTQMHVIAGSTPMLRLLIKHCWVKCIRARINCCCFVQLLCWRTMRALCTRHARQISNNLAAVDVAAAACRCRSQIVYSSHTHTHTLDSLFLFAFHNWFNESEEKRAIRICKNRLCSVCVLWNDRTTLDDLLVWLISNLMKRQPSVAMSRTRAFALRSAYTLCFLIGRLC